MSGWLSCVRRLALPVPDGVELSGPPTFTPVPAIFAAFDDTGAEDSAFVQRLFKMCILTTANRMAERSDAPAQGRLTFPPLAS
ncbi:hypothetical protein RRG08_029199 [Elysia crispata]|uniref:Uncharacterized protein n=1 Tax=Elysia crispata TaxID=231223 RepID=A0AAE1AIW1_9GAST|nr:hypothetical protein RRG08_029199 [Elysia crispata]